MANILTSNPYLYKNNSANPKSFLLLYSFFSLGVLFALSAKSLPKKKSKHWRQNLLKHPFLPLWDHEMPLPRDVKLHRQGNRRKIYHQKIKVSLYLQGLHCILLLCLLILRIRIKVMGNLISLPLPHLHLRYFRLGRQGLFLKRRRIFKVLSTQYHLKGKRMPFLVRRSD